MLGWCCVFICCIACGDNDDEDGPTLDIVEVCGGGAADMLCLYSVCACEGFMGTLKVLIGGEFACIGGGIRRVGGCCA